MSVKQTDSILRETVVCVHQLVPELKSLQNKGLSLQRGSNLHSKFTCMA